MNRKFFRAVTAAAFVLILSVQAQAARMLIPVGKVVGLSLSEGSVTVVAFDDELGASAREAGVQIGDEILSVDGCRIDSAEDLHQALCRSDGEVRLKLCRDNRECQVKVSPALTDDGPRLGVYIREGVTGIGTVTYYDPVKKTFGTLGHGVSDKRGQLAEMISGQVCRASVVSVKRGQCGHPGQLRGAVSAGEILGELTENTPFGVFGAGAEWSGEALPAAEREEVQTGPAQILSNVTGDAVEAFSVQILKIYEPDQHPGRDLMIQVTDPELLEITGGIVAGMSGSPIIQDGKLVGAVTHVLVNDPTTGYGIFIENMLDAAA